MNDMGMFDDVVCEMPLPDNKPGNRFQTKDFDEPYLEKYTITTDGRLLRDDPWWKRPKGKRSAPVDMNFHGVLNFYDFNFETKEWREFNAKFTDGKLVSIEVVTEHQDAI
jgi:hypothetical protein